VWGKNPRFLQSGKTDPKVYKELWDTILNGDMWKGEICNKKKDGSLFWEYCSISGLRNHESKIMHLFAIKNDITERKKAEELALENSKLLSDSQTAAHIGSYEQDVDSGRWKCSEMLETIFGIDKTYPHTTEGWVSIVHPDSRGKLLKYYESVVTKNRNFDIEYKIIRQNDGIERWVHGLGKVQNGSEGKNLYMIGTILDITERKRN